MKTVYETLFQACQSAPTLVGQSPGESDEDFIRRFAARIAEISNDVWAILPSHVHMWYNNTARCINGRVPFENWPQCEGFVSVNPPAPLPEAELASEVVSAPVTQEAHAPAPEKERRVAPKNSKNAGAIKETRRIMMLHPEWSARLIHRHLIATEYPGIKFELVSVVASETRALIYLARELGFWREVSIYEKNPPKEEAKETKQGASPTSSESTA